MTKLQQKTALVFGGSRGIGAGAVKRLAEDGYAVAFTYVSQPDKAEALVEELAAHGHRLLAIKADSADPIAITAAVQETVEAFGRLQAIVVNAGIFRMSPIETVSLAELDLMLDVNVRGVYLAIQAALPHLEDGGRIITIGSNVAVRSGHAGTSVYQLTKAAVAAMVKGIALDTAPRRITVNNIQPGPTKTDITSGTLDMLAEKSPLHRVADTDEIAGLVSYLAGPESSYMTGASLTIDGGWVL